MRPIAALFTFVLLAGSPSAAERVAPADAAAILAQSERTYRTCSSYTDQGVVRQHLAGATLEKPFATAFKRPDLFRYTFSDAHQQFVVRTSRGRVERLSTLDGTVTTPATLELGLAEAAGTSGGSASLVPSLLGIAGTKSFFARLHGLRRGADAVVNGTLCNEVMGFDAANRETGLWIGAGDHLLRRMTRAETTIDDQPRLNAVLTAGDFALRR